MPAGCDFICGNLDCVHHDKRITMTEYWNLGKIEDVIASERVSKIPDFKAHLEKLQKEGQKWTVIAFPNNDKVKTEGFKADKWCPKCNSFHVEYVIFDEGQSKLEDLTFKDKCEKCEGELSSFEELVSESSPKTLNCPFCKSKMEINKWFSNEFDAPEDNKE